MTKILSALLLVSNTAWAAPENYNLDEGHAAIVFKANHLGFSNVYGMFGQSLGTMAWDAADPSKSTFEITTKADSLNTLNAKRDEHLKGPDFFNVKEFPNITLKSKSIKKQKGNKFEVTADLTLRGVTKPVKFTFEQQKTGKDPWGNMRTGGDAAFKIKRTDFGMNYMSKPGEISDEIEMMISLEAIKK